MKSTREKYLRALSSPARLEVVEGLQLGGASSVAELARRLGRAPSSLYHHLDQLEAAGVVETRGRTAGKGGRRGAIYTLKTGPVGVSLDDSVTERERAAMGTMARAVLRSTERDIDRALRGPETGRPPAGLEELPIVQRSKAWLSPADVTELTALLEPIEDFLRARAEPDSAGRSLCALTFALTTLVPKGAR